MDIFACCALFVYTVSTLAAFWLVGDALVMAVFALGPLGLAQHQGNHLVVGRRHLSLQAGKTLGSFQRGTAFSHKRAHLALLLVVVH